MAATSYSAQSSHFQREQIVREIQSVFREKLSAPAPAADEDLFRSGVLEPATMVQLLVSLEDRFGLRLPIPETGLDAFRTVAAIAERVLERLLERLRGPYEDARTGEYGVTEAEVAALFHEKMGLRIESLESDLFQTGVFDSMTLVSFILHLEERFGVRFPMEELDIEAGVTVATLAGLVSRAKRASAERVA